MGHQRSKPNPLPTITRLGWGALLSVGVCLPSLGCDPEGGVDTQLRVGKPPGVPPVVPPGPPPGIPPGPPPGLPPGPPPGLPPGPPGGGGCTPTPEKCDDPVGIDEDCDGLIDCADDNCSGHPACVEGDCADGVDNDGDGATDCADFDCTHKLDCTECTCENAADDDTDGQVDCDDLDCGSLAACVCPPNEVFDASDGECRCDENEGYFLDPGTGACLGCEDIDPADPYWDNFLLQCEQCPFGALPNGPGGACQCDAASGFVDAGTPGDLECECSSLNPYYNALTGACGADPATLTIQYRWFSEDGTDLDTETILTSPDTGEAVGYCDSSSTTHMSGWMDVVSNGGTEVVHVDLAAALASVDTVEVDLNAWWWNQRFEGDVQLIVSDGLNTVVSEHNVVPEHSSCNDVEQHLGVVTFDGPTGTLSLGEPGDQDGDGTPDATDNCPDVANPDQSITPGNPMGDACMWPNQVSMANSDPWIVDHHDDLRLMQPRVLVVNYANGYGVNGTDTVSGPITTTEVEAKAQEFLDELEEGSRFHGYRDPEAPAFIQPEIWKVVDLQDGNGHANSDTFPRGAEITTDKGTFPLVGYADLFSEAYAPNFGELGPDGDYLTLGELIEQGIVHDIVMVANQVDDKDPNPDDQVTFHILEVAYVAQAYDDGLTPLDDLYVRNGCPVEKQMGDFEECDNSMPWNGRSARIYFLNATRGAGCLMHSLGHAFEHKYNESEIYDPGNAHHGASSMPWLQPYFRSFGGFDLESTLGTPFPSLYAGGDAYTYSNCNADGVCSRLNWPERVDDGGNVIQTASFVDDYTVACGNVHYPPGARAGYEYYPPDLVPSVCETFMQPDQTAAPVATPWRCTGSGFDDDCGGRFLIYWMQNMPGLHNLAEEPGGTPMRNWWPLMYY